MAPQAYFRSSARAFSAPGTLNHALVMLDRERIGREASPAAAVIDTQSIKTTESGGPRGYDAGKRGHGDDPSQKLTHRRGSPKMRCFSAPIHLDKTKEQGRRAVI